MKSLLRVHVITVQDSSLGFRFHNILQGGYCTPEPRPTAPTLPGQEWLLLLKSWGGTRQEKGPALCIWLGPMACLFIIIAVPAVFYYFWPSRYIQLHAIFPSNLHNKTKKGRGEATSPSLGEHVRCPPRPGNLISTQASSKS